MTGLGNEDTASVDDVSSIEDLAAGWVVDRSNGISWTPERQAELDAWLVQSVAHRVAYVRISAGWLRSDRLAALRSPMREQISRSAPRSLLWVRIASAFGLVAVTGYFAVNYLTQPKAQLIETPKGGQERLTLADGSQIELNTDSAIRIAPSSGGRNVELVRGEAYFKIKHESAHPFVVHAAGRKIVDLGTRFTVRSTAQSLQVALVEGSIRLEGASGQPSQTVTLSPGDVAVATATKVNVSRISDRQMTDRLAWQRGGLVFHDTALADVVAEFNRYSGPQLVLGNPEIANLTINGRFRITGAEDFAANVHEIFGLRVKHNHGTITLTR